MARYPSAFGRETGALRSTPGNKGPGGVEQSAPPHLDHGRPYRFQPAGNRIFAPPDELFIGWGYLLSKKPADRTSVFSDTFDLKLFILDLLREETQ
jgi:hypothetical protein